MGLQRSGGGAVNCLKTIKRLFRYRRTRKAKKAHEALKQLETAINMPRKDGRIEAIREAWDGYMTARKPYKVPWWKRGEKGAA